MASIAFGNVELEKFVFCDCSDEMIAIAKERFDFLDVDFVWKSGKRLLQLSVIY